MEIQEVFYWFATVAMALTILCLIAMVGLLFYIKKKITDLDKYGKLVIHKADGIVDEVKNKIQMISNLRTSILGKSSK